VAGRDRSRRADAARPVTTPPAVRLHLHRGIGWGVYGAATLFVFVLVLIGATSYLLSGRFVMAAVTAVVGLALTAFLAVVTHAMITPSLTVTADGIRGRMPRGNTVDARWDEVTIDVDDDVPPGTIRLGVADESVSINARAWSGVRDFVILVARTPHAADRLTPAALQEWLRLLGVTQVEPADE
jgi:hypothetical protein